MKYNFLIDTMSGNKIELDVYSGDKSIPKPVVVFVHGFKGFKDWGFFPSAAGFFEEQGYHSIVFNFSHNGITSGNDIFNELEKFEKNTLSLEVDELKEISLRVISNEFCNFNGELFIIGHSRGGAVTLLASPEIKNLSALSVWASISYVDRYTDRQKKEWKQKGCLSFLNTRTGQEMKLDYSFLEDILINKNDKLSVESRVRMLDLPILTIHGEIDLTVPVKDAGNIYSYCKNPSSEFFIVPKAGHTFNMVHPPGDITEQFNEVLNKTESFFRKYNRG